jgi:hypothetical protein
MPLAWTMSRTSFEGYSQCTWSRVLPFSSVRVAVTTETTSGNGAKTSV